MTDVAAKPSKRTTLETLRALGRPKVAVMAALGFSSGLPFMLIGNTLGYWLREGGVALAAIGFLSWAGLAYLFKFIWGAVVDRASPPLLSSLGRRRGWMIWTQIGVGVGLLGMAAFGPRGHVHGDLRTLGAMAVLTAISAASQDTVVDAWRIEIAEDSAELGLLTSAYSLAYRIAILATDAWILAPAALLGWANSYALYAALVLVGIAGALFAKEPARADAIMAEKTETAVRNPLRGAYDTVIEPFIAFFRTHGWAALLMLAVISLYHLCDYLRGPIINPYYVDLHIPKAEILALRTSVGLAMTLAGTAVGGLLVLRIGVWRTLIIGGVLQPIAVAAFSLLAYLGPSPVLFSSIMTFDGFSMSLAGIALISYMSTLTSLGYTATQYALLTSALVWAGKTLKGFSGAWVQGLVTPTRDLAHAYALFQIYAGATGIPALALVLWLARTQRRRSQSAIDDGASALTS
jgi:MFS transporter, PAT family, beta-lactamase induction signal transducer AmpG